MSSPYRDTVPTEDHEPVPDFGVDRRLWPGLLRHTVVVVLAAIAAALFGDLGEAALVLIRCGPGIVLGACIALLMEPVGRWLARRRARLIVEGIAELERKVSAGERHAAPAPLLPTTNA